MEGCSVIDTVYLLIGARLPDISFRVAAMTCSFLQAHCKSHFYLALCAEHLRARNPLPLGTHGCPQGGVAGFPTAPAMPGNTSCMPEAGHSLADILDPKLCKYSLLVVPFLVGAADTSSIARSAGCSARVHSPNSGPKPGDSGVRYKITRKSIDAANIGFRFYIVVRSPRSHIPKTSF